MQQHQIQLGERPLSLYDDLIWGHILRRMNATWAIVKHNYTNRREALKHGIDIFPLVLTQTAVVDLNVYPIKFMDHVIIVPEALPYSEFSAYLRNATSGELIGYSFVSMVQRFWS